MLERPGVQWWVTKGQHVRGSKKDDPTPTPRLDHPGKRVAQGTGLEHPGRSKAARRRPPGLEHPGRNKETRGRSPGLEHPEEVGERPEFGSPGSEKEGVANKVPTPVSTGDKRLGWRKLNGSTVDAGRRAPGLRHTGKEGKKPRTRASWTEQGGKKASFRAGTSRGLRRNATDWYVRCRARRKKKPPRTGSIRERKEDSPGLDHTGVDGSTNAASDTGHGWGDRKVDAGTHAPGLGLMGNEKKNPRIGASRAEQGGTKTACWTGASSGSRRTAPDRPG